MNQEDVIKTGKDDTVIVIFTNFNKDMHILKITKKMSFIAQKLGK
ncbi:MAG: hypothetical protein ACRCZW_10790 [Lactobacillaceae bacterium]